MDDYEDEEMPVVNRRMSWWILFSHFQFYWIPCGNLPQESSSPFVHSIRAMIMGGETEQVMVYLSD